MKVKDDTGFISKNDIIDLVKKTICCCLYFPLSLCGFGKKKLRNLQNKVYSSTAIFFISFWLNILNVVVNTGTSTNRTQFIDGKINKEVAAAPHQMKHITTTAACRPFYRRVELSVVIFQSLRSYHNLPYTSR